MRKVYMLHHIHEFEDGSEDVKFIGAFSTRAKAEQQIAISKLLEGFRDFPDGFSITECVVDRVGWTEGFISWKEALNSTPED